MDTTKQSGTKQSDKAAKQSDELANVSPLLHPIPVARKLLGDPSHGHFYNLINAGELELVKLGAMSRITDRSIRALIDRGGIKKLGKGTKERDKGAA